MDSIPSEVLAAMSVIKQHYAGLSSEAGNKQVSTSERSQTVSQQHQIPTNGDDSPQEPITKKSVKRQRRKHPRQRRARSNDLNNSVTAASRVESGAHEPESRSTATNACQTSSRDNQSPLAESTVQMTTSIPGLDQIDNKSLPVQVIDTAVSCPGTKDNASLSQTSWSKSGIGEHFAAYLIEREPELDAEELRSHASASSPWVNANIDSPGSQDLVAEIAQLRMEVMNLRNENDALRQASTSLKLEQPAIEILPWSTIYEVHCSPKSASTYYSDRPVLLKRRWDNHEHWDARHRIPDKNVKKFKRDSGPFVIQITYFCHRSSPDHADQDPDDSGSGSEDESFVKSLGSKSSGQESVHVLSKDLLTTLKMVFNSVPGLQVYWEFDDLHQVVFPQPYPWFYQFEKQITLFIEENVDNLTVASQGLYLLLQYLRQQTNPKRQAVSKLFRAGQVVAAAIPFLYIPETLLVVQEDDQITCAVQTSRIVSRSDGQWVAHIRGVEFDGKFKLSESTMSLRCTAQEPIEITSMPFYPLTYAPAAVKQHLLTRGRQFYNFSKGPQYVTCAKKATDGDNAFEEIRYMVDPTAYLALHADKGGDFRKLVEPDDESGDQICGDENDESFLYQLPAWVNGYRMVDKKWVRLPVEDIQDVDWKKNAFEDLVIEDKTKKLVEALVTNKISTTRHGLDFIKGKGNGLIILLHGGPGTGKTLTAETVAEIAKRPLFRITCGDMGTNALDVEEYLRSVFYLGVRWGCVVLLDEADVFLEERTFNNLDRNALVSVFLRVIEYYEGILILTTNRVGRFDEAFKSRIQLSLRYRKLNKTQRRQIWENFIKRLENIGEDADFEDIRKHLHELARHEMNGRQIRNATTTARQLAQHNGERLCFSHLKDVIDVSQDFETYMQEVNAGVSAEELAFNQGNRLPDD